MVEPEMLMKLPSRVMAPPEVMPGTTVVTLVSHKLSLSLLGALGVMASSRALVPVKLLADRLLNCTDSWIPADVVTLIFCKVLLPVRFRE